MQLSKIIIGLILTGVLSLTFLAFVIDGTIQYNPANIPSDYASDFNQISADTNQIINTTEETETELNSLSGNNNAITDFIGWFFGNGYQAVKTFMNSVKLTGTIANQGIDNTLGATGLGNAWKAAILAIITVVIVTLILHFVIKSDRL